MRKLLLILILYLAITRLYSLHLSVDDSGFSISSADFSVALDYQNISLRYKGLSYGDIARKGIIRTLLNPHEYTEFEAIAMPFRKSAYRPGFVLSNEYFDIFYTTSPRAGVGFSTSSFGFSFMASFFAKEEEELKASRDNLNSLDKDVMYFGVKYDSKFFSFFSIASFDEFLSFSGILGGRLTYSGYSLELRLGNIMALDKRNEYEIFTLKANIDKKSFNAEWKVSFGNKPIYSYEYMSKESRKSVELNIGNISIESEYISSFSSKGILTVKRNIYIGHRFLAFGYDSEKGFLSRVRYKEISLSFQRDSIEFSFDFNFSDTNFFQEGGMLSISISNKELLKVSLAIEL